jgi:1-acyl-sn-glycerol-3-phosphate acyltransferase
LIRDMARWGLALYGVRVVEHHRERIPARQCVFISNHTSSLDVAVIVALGLPNSRYFMSGFLKKIPPLAVIGWLLGMFWTVKQEFPDQRRKIFQQADATLRQTGESVFLTPEGQQVWTFNKGAFHLAASLQVPIVPLYILIPNEVDPGPWDSGEFYAVRPGVVDVYVGEPIDTTEWDVEHVAEYRDQVRRLYIDWYTRLHQGRRPPVE